MTMFSERVGLGKKIEHMILKPTVLCDSVNQATSYWSSVPHHPNLLRGPWPPARLPLTTSLLLTRKIEIGRCKLHLPLRSASGAWTSWGMLYGIPHIICLRGVMVVDRKTENMNWPENIQRDLQRVNRNWSHVRTVNRSKRRAVTTARERSLPQESGHYRGRVGVPNSKQMLQYIFTRLLHTTFFPLRETTGWSFLLLIKMLQT